MSAYDESQSSVSQLHHVGVSFNLNHIISSPTTSRSGRESDGNALRRGPVYHTTSTCPETNVARYAESLTIPIRANLEEDILFEMDHSASISKDIGMFLNDTKLYDYWIKVKRWLPNFTNQTIFVSDSLEPQEEKADDCYETFRVHKVILAARWPYFQTFFLSNNWKDSDKNHWESVFEMFEPEWMKIYLEYVYTGKLRIQLRTIMGVLRIASFWSMEIIMNSWKRVMDSDYFTAFDLCHLYKQARYNDFDGMLSYLSELIPKKTTNETIWKILKEIWWEQDYNFDSDNEIDANNHDESRSMTALRSTKSDLFVKHALSLKQEVMTELLSASDEKSIIEEDEKDLPHRLLNKIQKSLPEIYEKDETLDDLIRLPKSALIKIFMSDKSCAPELTFFYILWKIANIYNPTIKLYPLSLHWINKSSVDGTCNEENHITINELEEEKEEEEEIVDMRTKQIQDINKNDFERHSESKSEGEDDNEEGKSIKLEALSARTSTWSQLDSKKHIKELIPYVRLSLINRKSLITDIRESRYFNYDSIFEALVFQDIPDRIPEFKTEKRFRRRGFKIEYDQVHEDIEVINSFIDKKTTTLLKRVKRSNIIDSKYVTATHSDPLPLHGIHYFEVKIMPSQNQNVVNKIFIGLCNPNETPSLEDTFKDKSSLFFYTYDANFWSNGNHISNSLGSRSIRFRNSLDGGDILRIVVDFRLAKSFQSFWKDQEENHPPSSENRITFGQGHSVGLQNRNSHSQNISNEENGIRIRTRDNLNLFLNDNSDPIFFNSPWKLIYAINNGEFSEGIDINLMSLETAPIHFGVSLLEVGQQVECSRWVYFDSLENIPTHPFLLEKRDSKVKASHRSVSISRFNARNFSENSNLLTD